MSNLICLKRDEIKGNHFRVQIGKEVKSRKANMFPRVF